VFRDGAWQPVGEGSDGPARVPGRDPLLPTGITLAAASLVTTAIGVGWLASAGSSRQVCGLSGCIGFSDPEAQNSAVAMIAGGVGAGLLSGAVAYFGAKGPASPRRSNPRMVAGVVFTTIGVANAVAGVANAIAPYQLRGSRPGEVDPVFSFSGSTHTSGQTVLFTLVSATCLGIGLPLWITGAWAPRSRSNDAASSLDLLPAPGGAAIRWTR
jgi:hypothetical protein